MRRAQQDLQAAAAFAAVTHTTETQFGEVSREIFQAGDQLQSKAWWISCSGWSRLMPLRHVT